MPATHLRRAFDEAFAAPLRERAPDGEPLLVVHLAGARHLVRLTEVRAVGQLPPLTPVPSAAPTLLGVGTLHGALVAVHDLAAFLGAGRSEGRQVLVNAAEPSLVLAVDAVEGVIDVAPDRVPVPTGGLVCGLVPLDEGAVPLVDLAAVVTASRSPAPIEERSG